MDKKGATLVRVLINRFHKGTPEALLHYFPENEAEDILKIAVDSSEISQLFPPFAEQLPRIHYTWFVPILQKTSSVAQGSLLSAFPEDISARLSNSLGLSSSRHPLPTISQQFLMKLILKNLQGLDQVTPLAYLPTTPLTQLGNYNKADMVQLISFLGIHDLAEEIRHIVDKKRIKNIYLCLTPKEQQYLRYCMHLKEKFIAPTLGLDKWSGDCEKLKATLQARGIIRLGKSLSGEHPDLIWHLAHILDMGRGKALSKHYAKEAVANLTPALAQQVTNLMGILKKKSGT